MVTEADLQRQKAGNSVTEAMRAINQIRIEECSGHDELTNKYKRDLDKAYSLLIEARSLIGAV